MSRTGRLARGAATAVALALALPAAPAAAQTPALKKIDAKKLAQMEVLAQEWFAARPHTCF